MSEEFNNVYMYLFDDENHEKSMSEVQKSEKRPVFMNGNDDKDIEDLLLLMSRLSSVQT